MWEAGWAGAQSPGSSAPGGWRRVLFQVHDSRWRGCRPMSSREQLASLRARLKAQWLLTPFFRRNGRGLPVCTAQGWVSLPDLKTSLSLHLWQTGCCTLFLLNCLDVSLGLSRRFEVLLQPLASTSGRACRRHRETSLRSPHSRDAQPYTGKGLGSTAFPPTMGHISRGGHKAP